MPLPLPPPPPGCRSLTDPEVERLRKREPDLWANPHKTCLTCGKKGPFKARINGEVAEYDCDCVAQWRMNRWLLNSGVGLRYQRLSWDDVTAVPEAVQAKVFEYILAAEYHLSEGTGLTLWAEERGTGKTLLSTLLFKRLIADGANGYFTQFNQVLDAFTATWRDADERAWFTRTIRNAGVLVIDDIGREHKGRVEMVEAMLDEIIRHRVNSAKPTFITTNFTPDQMRNGYGHNILSLLSEVNSELHVPGRDFRPEVTKRNAAEAAQGLRRVIVVG